MDDEVNILKATPITDTKIIGKDYTLNHKPMPFIVYLKDNNNNSLKDLTVKFTINGATYSRTTATDGSAQLNINLGAGNYPITYAFMGNANYKSTSAKSTIKIVNNKLTPTINANDLTKYHDESSAYKVVLLDNNGNPLVNENIQIKINGVTYTRTTGNKGDATLNINLNEGKYTITTTYNGNSYYNSISKSNIITVNKKTTTLSGDALTKYYGDNTPYAVKIQDNNKKAISGANIIFTVNGKSYTRTTNNNGIATLNINLNEGTYQINSLFNENDDYKKSTLTKTITINKKATTLTGSDVVKFYGDNTAYTVQLLDNNKKALTNVPITINVNSVNYARTTDANGKATLNINLKEGKYTITTKYNGNDYYKASTLKNTLTVNKKATTLTGSDVVKFYGDTTAYAVQLLDNNKKALANTPITINVNGVDYTRTTDANGKATLNINLKEGKYTITSKFNGNDYYKAYALKNTVTVNKKATTLTGSDVTKFYGDNTKYCVQLLDNNKKAITNAQITINVNGVDYARTTDANGKATLSINLKEGKYTITTKYNGNDYYKASTLKNTLTVNKKATTLSGSDVVKFYGDNTAYTVQLLDNNKKALTNVPIIINVNGVDYARTTDANGKSTLNIKLMEGSYTITAKYNGNNYYKASTLKNTLTVNKKATTLTGSDVVKFYGDDTAYTVQLLDNNKKALTNAPIIINVNGVDYARNTDANGKSTLNIKLMEGSYTITAKYNGNDYYKPSTLKNTVTVNKKVTTLKGNDLTKYCGDNTPYTVQLLDNQNKAIKNAVITINVNGANYICNTDNNGKATLTINLKEGIYTITSKYNGDDYYKQSIIKNSLIIKYYTNTPAFSVEGGYYDVGNLMLNISSDNPKSTVFYSLNNASWFNQTGYVCLNLTNGNWTIQSFVKENGMDSTIVSKNYIIDNAGPIVFSSNGSGVYKNSLKVQLTAIDNVDVNPVIYYSLNGVNFIPYDGILNIFKTTVLNFYAIDFYGHKSDVITCNYIFEKVGNLNSGKGFNTIQSAIDDVGTNNGDLIMVSEGLYNEHLTINKFINLVGVNAELCGMDSSRPVIGVSNGGSNSTVQGFKIKDSDYGVVVYQAENVSIINNHFVNIVTSIETDCDKNTIIAYNSIDSNKFINSMYGIVVRKSDNSMILNNNITLNSKNNVCGIFVLNNTSQNISIVNNQISNKNKLNGIGLYTICSNMNIESNNISDFNTGFYVVSSNSKVIHNEFKNNRYGVFLRNSVNNTYAFNNIHDNILYGFVLDESVTGDDSFYLNRLFGNAYYDFYSNTNCSYVLDNNWWGENTPKISKSSNIHANIYNKTGNLVMNSWVVVNLFSSSYKINEYSQVERAKFYVDLTYNNLGKKLSSQGYIPDNIESFISVFNIVGDNKANSSYLKDGKAFVDFELKDLFKNQDNIGVMAFFDNEKIVKTFNKNATIDITLFSTAGDVENNYFVNRTYHIPYKDNVSWVTFSWAETGLYTGKIYVIVNGDIIDEINIENVFYHEFKNTYSTKVFEAIKLLNNVFASMKEGVWEPNGYYLNFAKLSNIDASNFNLVYDRFLNYLKLCYDLNDYELNFVKSYKNCFIDKVEMFVDYHGEVTPDINFEYNGPQKLLNLPSSYASRVSNIYYTNIEDENNESIGYEGMRSFAIVKSNLTSDDLSYWLNQKELYAPGLMKAAYGIFLSPLLVIYENDRVADESASKFNVTLNRISPVCVSLCNDFNCLYITGDSNHIMGREAVGNASGVWSFNFATSFSFSLIEQLVGNNVWNTTKIGSVTLGLIESYLNNETLELFSSNGYIFIKHALDNTLLFLDLKTGIVRDCLSDYSVLGTMPCYHDNITENAWKYGNNLLDETSVSNSRLNSVIDYSTSFALIGGLFATDSLIIASETISAATLSAVGSIFFVIALPVGFELLRPELAEMLDDAGYYDMAQYYYKNNTLDIFWDAIEYFNCGELKNVPFEQKLMFSLFYLLNLNFNYQFMSNMIINHNSDLYKLLNLTMILLKSPDLKDYKNNIIVFFEKFVP